MRRVRCMGPPITGMLVTPLFMLPATASLLQPHVREILDGTPAVRLLLTAMCATQALNIGALCSLKWLYFVGKQEAVSLRLSDHINECCRK